MICLKTVFLQGQLPPGNPLSKVIMFCDSMTTASRKSFHQPIHVAMVSDLPKDIFHWQQRPQESILLDNVLFNDQPKDIIS
jgi:hypothetical protein